MVWPTLRDLNKENAEPLDVNPFDVPVPYMQLDASDATTHLDHMCTLEIDSKPSNIRLSSIICTIGPSSRSLEILEQMVESGMNIARLNFSHGDYNYHGQTIQNIRLAADNFSKKIGTPYPLAIALDTKGAEIRTGILEDGPTSEIELKTGEIVKITTDPAYMEKCSAQVVYVDYENIQKVVKIGNRIFIDDGLISLICQNISGAFLTCTIENGGILGSRKGVNLPSVPIDLPSLSEKDKSDIKFGIEQNIDMIFASFIQNAEDVEDIKLILGDHKNHIKIISKIENRMGIYNLDDIIQASDGIMVARGDLGVELPMEKVFLAQKSIIARCNQFGKPVICARQMLLSMTKKVRPTRAETSDIANAIIDGADCVMLSGETAKGNYPVECVLTMACICKEAESALWHRQIFNDLIIKTKLPTDASHAVAIAAVEASIKCLAAAIIVVTISGCTANRISQYRPRCPIIAVTRNIQVARQTQLHRAILPLHYLEPEQTDWFSEVDAFVEYGIQFGKNHNFIKSSDPIVVVNGSKYGSGKINTMRIIYVEEELEVVDDVLCVS